MRILEDIDDCRMVNNATLKDVLYLLEEFNSENELCSRLTKEVYDRIVARAWLMQRNDI